MSGQRVDASAIGINNNDLYENSTSLRHLSLPEILKLAEERARVDGVNRRSTNNPRHKRMAVSADVARRRSSATPADGRETGSTSANGRSDDNEEFFENIMNKMTAEKFMPDAGSRKRSSLWNKENSRDPVTTTIKRRKECRTNPKSVPSTTAAFEGRLLPRWNNNDSPVAVKIRSLYDPVQIRRRNQTVPGRINSTLDLCQEGVNMNEIMFNSTDYNSSLATSGSQGDSSRGNRTADDRVSTCFQETPRLRYNYLIDGMGPCSDDDSSVCRYYAKKSLKNFWISRQPSTVEENREPAVIIESPIFDAVDMEFGKSLRIAPISPEETNSVRCHVCNFDKEEYNVNPDDDYSQPSLPMMLDDPRRGIPSCRDKRLLT